MTEADDIVKAFLVESAENLARFDRNLAELEKHPDDREIVADIFRTIHTIKGTSGFLAFSKLEAVTQAGESLLVRLQDGRLQLTPEITAALLAMVGATREMLAAIAASRTDGSNEYRELIHRLKALQDVEPAGAAR
jgi:two-component system chemotaxis sensor kinase CheA